jgi:hypothetical protein
VFVCERVLFARIYMYVHTYTHTYTHARTDAHTHEYTYNASSASHLLCVAVAVVVAASTPRAETMRKTNLQEIFGGAIALGNQIQSMTCQCL